MVKTDTRFMTSEEYLEEMVKHDLQKALEGAKELILANDKNYKGYQIKGRVEYLLAEGEEYSEHKFDLLNEGIQDLEIAYKLENKNPSVLLDLYKAYSMRIFVKNDVLLLDKMVKIKLDKEKANYYLKLYQKQNR